MQVALAPVTPGAVAEDVRAEHVRRQLRPLGEGVSLVEERERRRDARQLVAAYAKAVEDFGPVDVRERRAFAQGACTHEQVESCLQLALLHPGPRLAGQRANGELGGAGAFDCRARLLVLGG